MKNYPAVTVALWSSAGVMASVVQSLPLLRATRPDCVMLHSSPSGLRNYAAQALAQIRLVDPGVRAWFGVAGDAGWRQAKLGTLTPDAMHAKRMALGELARELGAECVMWNCESGWAFKAPGFDRAAAERTVTGFRALYPEVTQAMTSFDCPTLHSAFPWAGWKGADFHSPQIYWAVPGGSPRGAGARRHRMHRRHWLRAVEKGWLPDGPFVPYLQSYGSDLRDTVEVANKYHGVCFWAAPTRVDSTGERAIRVLMALARKGFRGPGRVEAFQSSAGLVPDGVIGPLTLRALGVV